jgi:hypothetical protein
MKRLSLFLAIFLLTSLACAAPLTEYLVPSGSVLFQDAFDNPQGRWGVMDNDAGVAGVVDEGYHFYVKSANVNLWAHPGMEFATTRTEVEAYAPAEPSENRMGLVCRLRDDSNFYFFVISGDGYYGIGKVKNGQWSLLSGQMQPSAAILTGGEINILRADCIGRYLILYVNGQLVGYVEDSDFTSGDVGLLAGSFSTPGVDVYFDNFVVSKP